VAQEVRDFRMDNEDRIVRELAELLEIPNVTGDTENIRRNAAKLREMLEARGIETHLLPSAGSGPVIFGKLPQLEASRTLIFYAHYDGYPVEAAAWSSGKPFEPALWTGAVEAGGKRVPLFDLANTRRGVAAQYPDDWRLYARSTAADKSAIVALLTAIDALRAQHIPVGVNLKIVLDGQGEAGSFELERVAELNKNLLGADLVVTASGTTDPSGGPVVAFLARGTSGGKPRARAQLDSPLLRSVVETVQGAAGDFAKQTVLEEHALPLIFERLGLPSVAVPIANFDSHARAANENLRLGNLWRGIEIYAALLADLGQ
jgi:acetylornithine deacetylase/succinyl-diaminopimelate desuccinylase-like protein